MYRRAIALTALMVLAAACAPAGGSAPPTTSPPGATAPAISAFTSPTGTQAAPAVATLAWTVSDPQGTALTCTIDGDGNGTVDVTVPNCQGTGSRNVTLPAAGTYAPKLMVSDGAESAQATTSVIVVTGTSEPYNITLRPVSPLSTAARAAFDDAAARWSQILVRGVPDLVPSPAIPAGQCLSGTSSINFVDDLVVDIAVRFIDGPGGTLGSAGPCWVSGADGLTRVGAMEFDSADVDALMLSGQFTQVVLHEMAHVMGFGTLWTDFPATISGFNGFTGPDPRFVGSRAVAEWSTLGRTGGVPVEADGGAGTAYAHWDETTFNNELMTGWLNSGTNRLSRLTIASLADLGYRTDLTQADTYTLPTLLRAGADSIHGSNPARMTLTRPVGSG